MPDKRGTQHDEPPAAAEPPAGPQAIEQVPSLAGAISGLASANAPFIFFDGAPFLGHVAGVGQITLTASRQIGIAPDATVAKDHVVTGFLHASLPALRELRQAIDQVEQLILKQSTLASVPTQSPTAH